MALETATHLNDLVTTNPDGADAKSQGDDHIRLLKSVLKTSFPNITRPFNLTRSAEFSDSSEAKTANYTIVAADHGKIITMDASGGARTFTMPDPATDAPAGWAIYLGRVDAAGNTTTINRSGSATINGATSLTIDGQYDFVFLRSDGTNWLAIYVTGKIGGGLKGVFAQLAAANTFTADQTLQSDDASVSPGPTLFLYRNSASPAANDNLGRIVYDGENDADERITYARVIARILDETDGSEDGQYAVRTVVNGAEADRLTVGAGVTAGTATDQGAGTMARTWELLFFVTFNGVNIFRKPAGLLG